MHASYRCMVWKVAAEYRKQAKQPVMQHNNKSVSAALGSKQAHKQDEEKFEIPQLKFPSELEEEESIKLFRRCGGPLAASYAGRMKLVQDEKHLYGDGRPISFCRVSGKSEFVLFCCVNTCLQYGLLSNWLLVCPSFASV